MSSPKVFKLKTNLSLQQANAIIAAALEAGHKAKLQPLTIIVLDTGGHIIAMQREDGCGIARVEIAMAKAWGALGMGMSSRLIDQQLGERTAFLAAIATASSGRFAPVPGGVLITDDNGAVIGAVGISGDNSDNDESCAMAGIKAAGLNMAEE